MKAKTPQWTELPGAVFAPRLNVFPVLDEV